MNKIGIGFLADAMFLIFLRGRPLYNYIIHTIFTSKGLEFRALRGISLMRGKLKDSESRALSIEAEEIFEI